MNSVPAQLLLTLPGSVALSPFRIEKRVAGFKPGLAAAVTLDTRFVHFAQLGAAFRRRGEILAKILAQAPPRGLEPTGHLSRPAALRHRLALVVQGDGHRAQLRAIEGGSPERGIAFHVTMKDGKVIRSTPITASVTASTTA
jgi:hypothetical protein